MRPETFRTSTRGVGSGPLTKMSQHEETPKSTEMRASRPPFKWELRF